jgi:hypothetical protein
MNVVVVVVNAAVGEGTITGTTTRLPPSDVYDMGGQ